MLNHFFFFFINYHAILYRESSTKKLIVAPVRFSSFVQSPSGSSVHRVHDHSMTAHICGYYEQETRKNNYLQHFFKKQLLDLNCEQLYLSYNQRSYIYIYIDFVSLEHLNFVLDKYRLKVLICVGMIRKMKQCCLLLYFIRNIF